MASRLENQFNKICKSLHGRFKVPTKTIAITCQCFKMLKQVQHDGWLWFLPFLQKRQNIPNTSHTFKHAAINALLNFFVCPGNVVRHMDGITAYVKHRQHVAFQGVAYHQKFAWADIEVFNEFKVIGVILFGHHLNVVEITGKV